MLRIVLTPGAICLELLADTLSQICRDAGSRREFVPSRQVERVKRGETGAVEFFDRHPAHIRDLHEQRVDNDSLALLLFFTDHKSFGHDLDQILVAPEQKVAYLTVQYLLIAGLCQGECRFKVHHMPRGLAEAHSLGCT